MARSSVVNDFKLYDHVFIESNILSEKFDGVILVIFPEKSRVTYPRIIDSFVAKCLDFDKHASKAPTVWNCEYVSGGKLVLAPTGNITPYHDSKVVYNAAKNGMIRAIDSGVRKPLLVVPHNVDFPNGQLVSILGALEALYVPLQTRELKNEKVVKVSILGIHSEGHETEAFQRVVNNAVLLERSRIIARDISGGDPERMTPIKAVEYVRREFRDDVCITLTEVSDEKVIKKEYPLLHAVSRAASVVDRHKPRILQMEYNPTDEKRITETVMLVGKGMTYDTGGADIKISLGMAGMSRDKCGAAVVAGFMKACALFKPPHLKAVGVLCLCRNSIGEESYVSDEVLISRSGKTIRVTNTDAEGRLAMADALYHISNRAAAGQERNPHVYTIATLTYHARRSYDRNSAAMDNHVARSTSHAIKLQNSGTKMAEGIEVSYIRDTDIDANTGKQEGDDINQVDMSYLRAHQLGGAFMLLVSGLHEKNVKYTHLDITGASFWPSQPTAAPLMTLCHAHNILL